MIEIFALSGQSAPSGTYLGGMHPAEWLTPAMILALAGLIWRGFERISARVDRLESRVDRVESKFDSRFERLEAKLDSLAEQLKSIAIDVAVLKDRADRDSGHTKVATG